MRLSTFLRFLGVAFALLVIPAFAAAQQSIKCEANNDSQSAAAGTADLVKVWVVQKAVGGIPNPVLSGHRAVAGMADDGNGAEPASIPRIDSAVLSSASAEVRAANPWEATATESPPSAYLATPVFPYMTTATSAVRAPQPAMTLSTSVSGE